MKEHLTRLHFIITMLLTIVYITVFIFLYLASCYNFFDYIIITLIYISSLISLLSSQITGLIVSLVFLIFIGSFTTYEYYIFNLNNNFVNYIYILILPISSLVFGAIHNRISIIKKKLEPIESDMKELIRIDKITGFRNSKDFYLTLEEEMKRSNRYKNTISLLLVKIAYFEEFSAMHSEETVIKTFISLSKAISNITRNVDKPYRLKADTFAVILPNTDQIGSSIVKVRLKEFVQKSNIDGNKNLVNFEIKASALEFDNKLENSIIYKKACEAELEYDN